MEHKWQNNYDGIKNFAYKSIYTILKDSINKGKHIAITLHGIKDGLDESDSLLNEIKGIKDAILETNNLNNLRKITIIDKERNRVDHLKIILDNYISSHCKKNKKSSYK